MDEVDERESRMYRMDYYKGSHQTWSILSQYQVKEQNSYFMNTKISMLCAERDAAVGERDKALAEKKAALEERDMAIQQRDIAITECDNALRERDDALAALQFQESTMNGDLGCSIQHAKKWQSQSAVNSQSTYNRREVHVTVAFPISAISAEAARSHQVKRTKVNRAVSAKLAKSPSKVKKIGEDLNKRVTTVGSKAEWDAQDFDAMNLINFDESTMPIPVCSCTGLPRQCYKWGNGGWQSSCCTTSLSVYPLPQLPHKRHARIGGRKMSGSVFSRLLTRLAAAGHNLSVPLDLKNYWAKHGTNRYITIK